MYLVHSQLKKIEDVRGRSFKYVSNTKNSLFIHSTECEHFIESLGYEKLLKESSNISIFLKVHHVLNVCRSAEERTRHTKSLMRILHTSVLPFKSFDAKQFLASTISSRR